MGSGRAYLGDIVALFGQVVAHIRQAALAARGAVVGANKRVRPLVDGLRFNCQYIFNLKYPQIIRNWSDACTCHPCLSVLDPRRARWQSAPAPR